MNPLNLFLFNTAALGKQASDEELVCRVLAGGTAEFAVLMRRHNQRLYRVCRSVVANDTEAEVALQEAYLRAYRNLEQSQVASTFAVWLTKIAVFEALRRRLPSAAHGEPNKPLGLRFGSNWSAFAKQPAELGAAQLLEEAIDSLPPNYRTVFVLRHLEKLSAEETAACLLISRETAETRLLRSRQMLKEKLASPVLEQPAEEVFPFRGNRASSLIERVIEKIEQRAVGHDSSAGPQVAALQ
jgi:RNA polymerase sigma-70 factor (ECF subfamily)